MQTTYSIKKSNISIEYEHFQMSILPIDEILTGSTTLNERGSNSNPDI